MQAAFGDKEIKMANKRQSAKRAIQEKKRQTRNTAVKSATKSAVKKAIEAVTTKDMGKAKEAYMMAVKALSKAASKGSIPKARASRKISRLTLLAKKMLPDALPIKGSAAPKKAAPKAASAKK